MWIVEIDPGTPATPHSVTREEVFVVLDGTAGVTIGEDHGDAAAGDSFVVPPDTMFEVSNAGDVAPDDVLPTGWWPGARIGTRLFTPPWAE